MTASNQGTAEPLCGSALATEVSKWAYHDGWPLDAEASAELIDPPTRLSGRSHNAAGRVQNADQAISGATLPSGPDAAADEGMPGRDVRTVVRRVVLRPDEQPDERVEHHGTRRPSAATRRR